MWIGDFNRFQGFTVTNLGISISPQNMQDMLFLHGNAGTKSWILESLGVAGFMIFPLLC